MQGKYERNKRIKDYQSEKETVITVYEILVGKYKVRLNYIQMIRLHEERFSSCYEHLNNKRFVSISLRWPIIVDYAHQNIVRGG